MFTRGRVGPSVIFRGIHFFVSFVGPDIMIGRWRHCRMSSDRTSAKWHSWTWLQTWRTCFFRAPQYVRPINCVLSTPLLLKEMLRNEGSRFFYTVTRCMPGGRLWLVESRAPSLWLVIRYSALIGWHTRAPSLWLVESRAPSLWLVESRAIGGATVECPRIAPQRNGIRISTTRRDGRVFAKLRNFPHKSTCYQHRCCCRKDREMKAHAFYAARCMPGGRLWLVDTLELLPSDWLNLEPLALDTPRPMRLIWIRSYYSAVRVAILLSGPCRTVMSRLL